MKARSKGSSDSDDTSSSSGEEEEVKPSTQDTWVACDHCSKWRRVPAALAQALTDDTPWYCEHNPNKALASCDVPQELTNEQIDAINDGGEEEEDLEDGNVSEERARRRRMPAVWQLIKDNVLTHRKRKVQEEDDVMICNCKPHWRGGDGCGPDCINRMLCVECSAGFCPSEDRCTNQVFTKKQYAKLEVRRAGAKGFGLFALDNITAGQFIIEYIGEVLEEEEYLRRKDFYAEVGQRHYYFMNIGNGEVIDACRKGNRARFINHSCDPNCETQKWLARGELAIGLFALKDIAMGEELTFDYNFERYGDKPMRCYCASRTCRKFIGGTQDTYDESMVVIDPEDVTNDFQPVMLTDPDIDWAAKALLDWRVGQFWEKEKEAQILAKLERVCKARGVPWTPAHFHGTAPMPSADSGEALVEPEPSTGKAATGRARTSARKAAAAPASKDIAKEAAAARKASGKAASTSGREAAGAVVPGAPELVVSTGATVKVEEEEAVKEEEQKPFRGPLKAAYKLKAKEQQDTKTDTGSPKAGDTKPLPGAVPHPGALFAAVKAPAAPRRRGGATASVPSKTEASLASSATTALGPASQRRGAVSASDRGEAGAVTSSQMSAMTDVKDSLLNKVAEGGPKEGTVVAVKEEPGRERDKEREAKEAQSREEREQPQPQDKPVSAVANGHVAASKRKTWAVGSGVRGAGRRRSEIDRRLDQLVGPSGRMKEASRQNIIKVLRMFNLCDIGPTRVVQRPVHTATRAESPPLFDSCTADAAAGTAADGAPPRAGSQPPATQPTGSDTDALSAVTAPSQPPQGNATAAAAASDAQGPPQGPGSHAPEQLQPSQFAPRVPSPVLPALPLHQHSLPRDRPGHQPPQQPVVITARQRARMADLSLLLDVILKTSSATVRKDFVTCGVLNQLHQVIGRNLSVQYSVILRKILRAVEALPLAADDIYSVRTAHGTLADTLQELTTNQDFDVRSKASALLKKFPAQACQDQGLVQRPPGTTRRVATGFSPAIPPSANGPDGPHPPQEGTGLPPIPHRIGRHLRPNLPRGHSSMELHVTGAAASLPASPALAPDSPHLFLLQGDGGPAGEAGMAAEPPPKRRRRGFSDAPLPPTHGEGTHANGDERVQPPNSSGPARPLPYSYRHGSALLDYAAGSAPPPPPLDAEELFELLLVPEVEARRAPGYRDPMPPVRPLVLQEGKPHGEPSDMEVLFAVGVYDTDWQEAAQAAGSARGSSRSKRPTDAPPSPQQTVPMSPLCYSVTNSPVKPELKEQELAAVQAVEQARLAQHRQQQQQQSGLPHRASTDYTFHAAFGTGGQMPMIMDLRPGGRSMPNLTPPSTGIRNPSPGHPPSSYPEYDTPIQGIAIHTLHTHHRSRHMPGGPQHPQQQPDSPQLFGQSPAPGLLGRGGPQGMGAPLPVTAPPIAPVDADVTPRPRAARKGLSAVEWARPMGLDYPESWDEPDSNFEHFVRETVRYRLGKYVTQPDHPNRITSEDAHSLFRKIHREVVEKERQAFEGRRTQGLFKLIEKRKVEHNLKEFVRLSIRRAHAQQAGGA